MYVRSDKANPYDPCDTKAQKYGAQKIVDSAKEIISLIPYKKAPQTGIQTYLHHHGGENGYNDLGIYPKKMYSIVKAAYNKGFYEQVYSDSSCYGTVQHSLPSMINAVLDCKELLKVLLLSGDEQENTITLPLSGKVTINKYGTSKKRDRGVLLKDIDNRNSLVIKLTIQGTQIHTGNYTEDRRNISYTEDWKKRELNHSKSIAELVALMKDKKVKKVTSRLGLKTKNTLEMASNHLNTLLK